MPASLQGAQFQTEVFEKVERPYMLGLRASSQEMRRKFFQIYNKTIPTPLFDRLQFLICTQSWEKLAGSFWLKEALVSEIHLHCSLESKQAYKLQRPHINNHQPLP